MSSDKRQRSFTPKGQEDHHECGCAKQEQSYKSGPCPEADSDKSKKVLKISENEGSENRGAAASRRSPRGCTAVMQQYICKPPVYGSKEAIKRLSKVPGVDKMKDKSVEKEISVTRLSPECKIYFRGVQTFPKKPELTPEELDDLLEQEAKDAESAWMLTVEGREAMSHRKPCPKQQRARDAVKAIVEQQRKSEETSPVSSAPPLIPCLGPPVLPDPLPFMDADAEDITPEVAANMMYTQERGIRMICCPEETIRCLFPSEFATELPLPPPKKDTTKNENEPPESIDQVVEETEEGVNDSVYTRNMSQREEGETETDAGTELRGPCSQTARKYDKKGEFVLQTKAVKCTNRVQLRGNFAPWFPGYFVAFPDQGGPDPIQVAKSPSGIFQKAWVSSKPSAVPLNELYLVE